MFDYDELKNVEKLVEKPIFKYMDAKNRNKYIKQKATAKVKNIFNIQTDSETAPAGATFSTNFNFMLQS